MAKSKARKLREKLEREGKRNPSTMRLTWGILDGVTKRTPTKQEKLNKSKYKRDYGREDYNHA